MSHSTPDKPWLIIGRVLKPHGVRGDLLVEVITDFPERLAEHVRFGLGPADGPTQRHSVHSVRFHQGRWLLSVSGIRSRDSIEEWRGLYLFLPEQSRDELPPGYYYEHELVGLICRSPAGDQLGEIVGFDPDDSQSRVLVQRQQREYSVPWVPAIVKSVDLEAQTVVLDPPPGLLDDDALVASRSEEP